MANTKLEEPIRVCVLYVYSMIRLGGLCDVVLLGGVWCGVAKSGAAYKLRCGLGK
jgi:hypothetical protein